MRGRQLVTSARGNVKMIDFSIFRERMNVKQRRRTEQERRLIGLKLLNMVRGTSCKLT
jgi:hypothetical protein